MVATASPSPESPILGIHHITTIAADAQRTVDFFAGTLGLRLVKRTVNFDDPGTYHLYYGDAVGTPGTLLTIFPYRGARRGVLGAGQASATSFAVPDGSIDWWRRRLRERGVESETRERFGDTALAFVDPDGLRLELVASVEPSADDPRVPWTEGGIPAEQAIRGFDGVTLLESDAEGTRALLVETMGFRAVGAESDTAGGRERFETGAGGSGTRVDLVVDPRAGLGRVAGGSVHHVAFRVADDPAQRAWRQHLAGSWVGPTEVIDRQYFHSIYFREPGGVLFELATDPPGMTVDEPLDALGESLQLPPRYEAIRDEIEARLGPLRGPSESGS